MSLGATADPNRLAARAARELVGRAATLPRIIAALVALSLLLTGCAYFNTFHHAKQAYAKAQRIEKKSRSEKLPPEAARQYDQAIEKSAKVIFDHGGGWWAGIDDALFLMGASYFGKREYGAAIKKFRELILNYPDSEHVPESLFYTGLCYSRLRNQATAERTFARVLREYPDFKRRDEIHFATAQSREASGERERAIEDYRRLLQEFPKSPKREDVLERVGEIQFEDGRYDSALIAFGELAETTRDDELYFEAQLRVGACLVRLDEYDRALEIYGKILPDDPERDEQGGRVWLAMADAENRKGDHEKALEHLGRVVEHFEKRGVGIEAAFLAGYTYETYLQDYAQARESYEKVTAAAAGSVFKDQASRRLKNLRHLEELQGERDAAESDREMRAGAALQVAEFSLFEGRDPSAALPQYARVIAEFPNTSAAMRAAYARGLIYHEQDSLAAAEKAWREIIDRYPASQQAARAVELLSDLGPSVGEIAPLRARVRDAQAEQARRDLIAAVAAARADSLAEAVRADSLAALAAADSLAAPAGSESLTAGAAVDSSGAQLAGDTAEHAAADSAAVSGGSAAPFERLPRSSSAGEAEGATRQPRSGEIPLIRRAAADSLDVPGRLAGVADSLDAASRLEDVPDSLQLPERPPGIPDSLLLLGEGGAAGDSLTAPGDSAAAGDTTAEADSATTRQEE